MDWSSLHVPPMVALALVALIGYLVGRRGRTGEAEILKQSRHKLRRAQAVAGELEDISRRIRQSLTRHHRSLNRFKDRVGHLQSNERDAAWQSLCQEAEEMLKPTLQLAAQISEAYDQLRHQTAQLMAFTELRTDPLTGVSNRRAFDETLATQFALLHRYDCPFALVMFDIDHFKQINDEHGHPAGDRALQEIARLLDEAVRETDVVCRYGGEEFAVILPQTDLGGAAIFAERMRRDIEQKFQATVSGGTTAALDGDTPDSIIGRADAALYHAKTAGRNCIFRHTGERLEAVVEAPDAAIHP